MLISNNAKINALLSVDLHAVYLQVDPDLLGDLLHQAVRHVPTESHWKSSKFIVLSLCCIRITTASQHTHPLSFFTRWTVRADISLKLMVEIQKQTLKENYLNTRVSKNLTRHFIIRTTSPVRPADPGGPGGPGVPWNQKLSSTVM